MSIQTEKYRQSYIDFINSNSDLNRSFFITCNLIDQLSLDIVKVRKNEYKYLNTSRNELFRRISKVNTQFFRTLEQCCFTKDRKRLEKLSVIHMNTYKNHVHLVVETCEHLSKEMMKNYIFMSFNNTKKMCEIDIREVDHRYSLYEYLTKEQVDVNKDTVDIENSYFKKLN